MLWLCFMQCMLTLITSKKRQKKTRRGTPTKYMQMSSTNNDHHSCHPHPFLNSFFFLFHLEHKGGAVQTLCCSHCMLLSEHALFFPTRPLRDFFFLGNLPPVLFCDRLCLLPLVPPYPVRIQPSRKIYVYLDFFFHLLPSLYF